MAIKADRLTRALQTVLQEVGGLCILFAQVIREFVRLRFDGQETWRNLYRVGVRSYPIVIVTALFAGAIMVIQSGHYVRKTGATSFVGWASGLGVMAEVGPVLIGLMFSGRVGANNAAELATMTITEQVDALRALAIDPLAYLVVPRVLAMVVMLFLLTVLGDLFSLVGGAVTCQWVLDIDWRVFVHGILDGRLLSQFLMGLIKAAGFGLAIALVSCHHGLRVTGGAPGVGRAVNDAVVAAAIAIFVLDYGITALML